MKIHEYDEMMRYLTRPGNKLSKANKKAVVGNFHKKNDEKAGSPIKTEKIKRVVEVKPKPKPTPKPLKPEKPLEDIFDWRLAPWQDYPEDDDVNLVSQPSIDESNATWWNNMYYDYKKSGGELNFQQFKNMLLKEGDIGDLDAKKRLDGIRNILIA